jgi:imidazolonepropionase-like amidohydrolase
MDWIARQTRDPATVAASPNLKFMHPALVAQWLHENRYAQRATPERAHRFEQMVDFNARLVRAFAAAGIPMLAGTDASVPGVAYGFSLHDELQMLVKAGMTNSQVLQSATRLSAEFLGVASSRGTIEPTKAADLVLLDADPRVDIGNTRRITAVVIGGRYLSRAELDARMNDLANRFAKIRMPQPAGGTGR